MKQYLSREEWMVALQEALEVVRKRKKGEKLVAVAVGGGLVTVRRSQG